jgi:soluble P-type ATPase
MKKADTMINTSRDKARVLWERRQEIGDGVILFVGDSPTDLEALTTADVGIIIRDDSIKSGHKELAKGYRSQLGVLMNLFKSEEHMPLVGLGF